MNKYLRIYGNKYMFKNVGYIKETNIPYVYIYIYININIYIYMNIHV